MQTIRPTTAADVDAFRQGCFGDRIEEQTCRPIENRSPVERDNRKDDWTFVFDGRPAGWVSLFDFNRRNRSAEFGYGLVRPLRGQHIGKQMLASAFNHFFGATDLNKLHCQTASFNTPSVRLVESLGLTRDATLRAHHELDGALHDEYIYSLLKSEWIKRKNKPEIL